MRSHRAPAPSKERSCDVSQRRHFARTTILQDRVEEWARQVRAEADALPSGLERDALLKKVRLSIRLPLLLLSLGGRSAPILVESLSIASFRPSIISRPRDHSSCSAYEEAASR